jgi:hypothetical protein
MYTIFFTINCVEQLTFSKNFVDQLQFEQSSICCLKVKLLEINFYYTYGRWFLIFNQFSLFFSTAQLRQAVGIFVLTSFFELSQFEQLNISNIKHFIDQSRIINSEIKRPFWLNIGLWKTLIKKYSETRL